MKNLFCFLFVILLNCSAFAMTERNILSVLINRNDVLLVEGQIIQLSELKNKVKTFIKNPNNDNINSDGEIREFDYIGKVRKSKGIVSIACDRGTTYDAYIQVQNEIEKAFNELRDELAFEKFGKGFKALKPEYRKVIKKVYPKVISEAEPSFVWRNGDLVPSRYWIYGDF